MANVIIVIPVHSANPSGFELISFQQCFNILGTHKIVVLAPKLLKLDAYKKVVPNFIVEYIHPKWQSNLRSYNKLKTSKFFYNLFSSYDYLLTYELDAFVFFDQIDYWCEKGYDYIGAPWFDGFDSPTANSKLIKVGNSGFSLRNIKSIRRILKSIYYKDPEKFNAGKKERIKAYALMPFYWLANIFGENTSVQNSVIFEDWFFCGIVPTLFPDFKIATIEDALKFSFEVQPGVLFEMNHRNLPMGCHAWWRYDLNFWKPYIESFGYHVIEKE